MSAHTVKIVPLNRRGLALFFCLDTKEPKDQVIRNASWLKAFALQAGKTWAGGLLPPFVARSRPSGNIPDSPAAALRPPLFYRLSPEALRLTSGSIEDFSCCVESKKRAQWPVRARGREFCLCGGSDWPDLIFDYFVSRQSNSPSGE